MKTKEAAKWLVELHSNYAMLADKYGQPFVPEYAEAVAEAIMAMAERKDNETD